MDPGITDGQHTRLYDTNALQRVLDTMAAGVSARLAGAEQVSLVGVLRRGAPLADMLQERLVQRLPGPTCSGLICQSSAIRMT